MANNVIFSTIFLGNFADIDTDESNSTTESEASLLGTHGGPGDKLAGHITSVTTDSSDNILFEDSVSTADTWSYDTGAGPQVTDLDSVVYFTSTVTYTDGTSASNVLLNVVQMTNGDVFILMGDTHTALAAKAIESIDIVSVSNDDIGGIFQSNYDNAEFVCFTPGSRIDTPSGERLVQDLRVGDLVTTLDNGPQPITWVGVRTLTFPNSPETQKPFEFKTGCFGPGLPARDLIVSPQHRVLCATPDGECLAAAKSLAGVSGARQMKGKRAVTYHTVLFHRHEVIFANGLAVESFYPGRRSMSLLSTVQRLQVIAKAPSVLNGDYGRHARVPLKHRDALRLSRSGELHVHGCQPAQAGWLCGPVGAV